MLTLGSLFDGIGGFPLAGVRQGYTPVWASEIEPFPIEVTRLRFPQMYHLGDIKKLKGSDLPGVDVVCGGSPCQDLSVAGKRAGLKGERSGLFMEQIRIIKEMRKHDEASGRTADTVRPRYMVWENVPGAFSSADGEDFRAVLEETCRIADSTVSVPRPPGGVWLSAGTVLGYKFSIAWRIYDAQYWGLAQRRKRIYLVADFGGCTAPEILFKQDSLFGDSAKGEETREGTAACSETGIGASGRDQDNSRETDREWLNTGNIQTTHFNSMIRTDTSASSSVAFACNQRDEVRDLHDVSAAIQAQPGMKQQTFIADVAPVKEKCFPTLKTSEGSTNIAPSVLCLNDQGGDRMDVTEDITATLRAGMAGHPPLVLGDQPDLFGNRGFDLRYTGSNKVASTMSGRYDTGGNNVSLITQPQAFSLDSAESNSMKSDNLT